MDLSHTGATPRKPQAVQVTCDDTMRTLDRIDNSQLNPPNYVLLIPMIRQSYFLRKCNSHLKHVMYRM